jgi:hypothetical protein
MAAQPEGRTLPACCFSAIASGPREISSHKWLTFNEKICFSIYLAIRQISLLRIHAGWEILVKLTTRKREIGVQGRDLGR